MKIIDLVHIFQFSSVHFSRSVVSDSLRPHESHSVQASLSITNPRSLLKLMSIESLMPSSHLILCRPLLLLPPIPPSIRVFSNESSLHMRWPKYWSFSFSIISILQHITKQRTDELINIKYDSLQQNDKMAKHKAYYKY